MKLFVSALHCFFHDVGGAEQVIRSWNTTRLGFRDEYGLERTESMNEAEQRVQPKIQRVQPKIGRFIPVSAREDFLIDRKHDLLAVRIPSVVERLAHAEFINLETAAFTRDLVAGTSLIVLGAPIASRVHVVLVGKTLIPQVVHVRYDTDINTWVGQMTIIRRPTSICPTHSPRWISHRTDLVALQYLLTKSRRLMESGLFRLTWSA